MSFNQSVDLPVVRKFEECILAASISYAHRVGAKCVVADNGHSSLCIHGLTDPVYEISEDDPAPKVAPAGSAGIDRNQARIFVIGTPETQIQKVFVVLPDGFTFRNSSKGRQLGRSVSFDDQGLPVLEVRLLFAQMSMRRSDRLNALHQIPWEFWIEELAEIDVPFPKITFGEIFSHIHHLADNHERYRDFVAFHICSFGKDQSLEAWTTVAQNVWHEAERFATTLATDADGLFLKAIEETAIEHGGLPSQRHVQDRCEKLNVLGDWRDRRNKLGFAWLPPLPDWKRDWQNSERFRP